MPMSFVFPTHSENFGNVVIEALAAEGPSHNYKGCPMGRSCVASLRMVDRDWCRRML